jgi:RNA recognition motif-containing protein
MLRNLPNRYTAEELIAEILAKGFNGMFDFFYLPIDFTTKRNRGYSFINFHTADTARRFLSEFHLQRLERYTTRKILEVSAATTQGLDENIAHFMKKDVHRIQNPWFRPMIFDAEDDIAAMMGQAARRLASFITPEEIRANRGQRAHPGAAT